MAKKPYTLEKEKNANGHKWRWRCRANPSVTGTTYTKPSAIVLAEYHCGHGRSLKDAEFGLPEPPASRNPDFASCQTCSNKLVLRSSLSDFQTLKS